MELNYLFFSFFAVLAIVTAIITVSTKNPVVSAMSLVGHFLMLSGLYLTLQAQFLAIMQVLVYAGAIMVLVVFVIMLLNLGKEEDFENTSKFNYRKMSSYILGLAFIFQIIVLLLANTKLTTEMSPLAKDNGTVGEIGLKLFSDYLYPFEMISLLLIVAVIGALILGKKRQVL